MSGLLYTDLTNPQTQKGAEGVLHSEDEFVN